MAPEIFENKPYSLKADVYSFGANNLIILLIYVFNYNLDCSLGNLFKRNSL